MENDIFRVMDKHAEGPERKTAQWVLVIEAKLGSRAQQRSIGVSDKVGGGQTNCMLLRVEWTQCHF